MSQEINGAIIINAFDGMYRYYPDSGQLAHIRLKADVMVNNLSSAIGDWIYVATYGAGLWKIDVGSDEAVYCDDIFSPFIDIRNSRIGAVYGSEEGSLWVGCDFSGVLMFPVRGHSFIYRRLSNIVRNFDVPLSSMNIWKGNTIIGNGLGHLAIISQE